MVKLNKRGQFFIIFAVILGIIILGLATKFNFALEKTSYEQNFRDICKNYKYEIFKISEQATVNNPGAESGDIETFTSLFISEIRKNDKDFELIYVYGDNELVIVNNQLSENIEVQIRYGEEQQLADNVIVGEVKPFEYPIISEIELSNQKIDKEYNIDNTERFFFVALTEKDGEIYVCE